MRRRIRVIAAAVAISMLPAAPGLAAADDGRSRSRLHVDGLDSPVRIVVDKWDVPHIYAKNTADLFFAQGYNAARERLFQMDLWRRKGLGQLSEVFGEAYVEQDRAARLMLYRGDMEQEWESYGPEGKLAASRFAEGVNAYVDRLAEKPEELPAEFRKFSYEPARWTAEDVVRIRAHGLSQNLYSEVDRARIACVGGVDADQFRIRLTPEHEAMVPEGFDPCSLPADVLDTYSLAVGGLSGDGEPSSAAALQEGSNAWALSPHRTTTGRPILANDPHRALNSPSTRYVAHLNAPGLDVIGAGEPFAPGIALGHNGTSAWGLTVSAMDQEDLYYYELDPENPNRYRYDGGWEEMTTVTEEIAVAGGGSEVVELQYTRHGPVIKVDEEANRAYALRAAWLEPGMSPYYGSLKHLRATSFAEFRKSMDSWRAPGLSQVYANVDGETGLAVGGLAPKRTGYDGLLPVPGDGRYEWDGFVPPSSMPRVHNPENGIIATANEYNGTDAGLGYEWASPVRRDRIVEALDARAKSSPADSGAVQNDVHSLYARRLVELLQPLSSDDPVIAEALAMLQDWDATLSKDSDAAVLFEVWFMWHLGPNFLFSVLPPETAGAIFLPDQDVLVDAMENPDEYFGADGAAQRDALLLSTLKAAFADVEQRLGTDRSEWTWGGLLTTPFPHPLSELTDDDTAAEWNAGPVPTGGAWHTVNLAGYDPVEYENLSGPSLRILLDVGNWDASKMINAPGQSGDPDSPGYKAMVEKWGDGEYVPLLYSAAAIKRNQAEEIVLLPKR
ncbi:penicillin acylase family protein [Saccharomonospora azurea]